VKRAGRGQMGDHRQEGKTGRNHAPAVSLAGQCPLFPASPRVIFILDDRLGRRPKKRKVKQLPASTPLQREPGSPIGEMTCSKPGDPQRSGDMRVRAIVAVS